MPNHSGHCHCGAVQFTFTAPKAVDVTVCDCSICAMAAYEHVFVPQADLTITSGKEALTRYRFNTGAAQHLFCKHCGIKPLYIPRSHPESYSVNYRCITPGTMRIKTRIPFSGKNWEANIAALKKAT